jgi:hypothetical protein
MSESMFEIGIEKAVRWATEFLTTKCGPLVVRIDRPVARAVAAARGAARARARIGGSAEIVLVAVALSVVAPQATAFLDRLVCTTLRMPLDNLLGRTQTCSPDVWTSVLATAVSFVCACLLYVFARWSLAIVNDIADSEAFVTQVPVRPTRALVMGLSDISERSGGIETARSEMDKYRDKLTEFTVVNGERGSSWQQNLRRIAANIDTLEAIYILPSLESDIQFDVFVEYASAIAGRPMPICRVLDVDGQPFAWTDEEGRRWQDYESYNYVYSGIRRAIEQARADLPGLTNEEICMDVTAGQKIFSIASGIATLNNGLVFSYVTSQGADIGKVQFYDVKVTFADKLSATLKAVGA